MRVFSGGQQGEVQLRGQGRSQVQLGNEGNPMRRFFSGGQSGEVQLRGQGHSQVQLGNEGTKQLVAIFVSSINHAKSKDVH